MKLKKLDSKISYVESIVE